MEPGRPSNLGKSHAHGIFALIDSCCPTRHDGAPDGLTLSRASPRGARAASPGEGRISPCKSGRWSEPSRPQDWTGLTQDPQPRYRVRSRRDQGQRSIPQLKQARFQSIWFYLALNRRRRLPRYSGRSSMKPLELITQMSVTLGEGITVTLTPPEPGNYHDPRQSASSHG